MAWHLTPLHAPLEPSIALPQEGTVTVGRRPGNNILCKDLAVSGQHCILHCRGRASVSVHEPPEVEDCSTNGSYLNEEKIVKGQPHGLKLGDIISLTKLPDDPHALDLPVRVQFRLDFRDDHVDEDSMAHNNAVRLSKQVADVPPTAPDVKPVLGMDLGGLNGGGVKNCFAQDLLVQEQQSNTKITAQLLQSQCKLEEERHAAEAASRELDKIRKQIAEERARRHEAEESRDRLAAEAETLRSERRQLQELRSSHEELRQRHDVAQLELQTRQQKCTQLEAAQEQLRRDLEAATESHQKASQQHAELQTRARQAQERSDRLEQQYAEAKREADWAQEEGARLENELAAERKARELLDEQVSSTKEQVGKAEASERSAREALDTATAKRAELECQASSAHSDLEGARASARQAQQRLTSSKQLVERLLEAGQGLSAELKRRAEVWEKALADGNFDGLEEALANGGPTFAQVTCQVETPPTKSQHEGGDEVEVSALEKGNAAASPQAMELAEGQHGSENELCQALATVAAVDGLLPAPSVTPAAAATAFISGASTSVLVPASAAPVAETPLDLRPPGQIEEVAIDDDEDELLAAATRSEPAGETAARDVAMGSSAGALPGCSTAWSLEMLDAAPGGDLLPPAKRSRLNGEWSEAP